MAQVAVSPGLDPSEGEGRLGMYSPASTYSQYSTYSREVKYIFEPLDEQEDEYADYSHIAPKEKQHGEKHTYRNSNNNSNNNNSTAHLLAHTPHTGQHTPRTISAASSSSFKPDTQTEVGLVLGTPDDVFVEPHLQSSRANSVSSFSSRDRCPISPASADAFFHPMTHRNSDGSATVRERTSVFSPISENQAYPVYHRHAPTGWRNHNDSSIYSQGQNSNGAAIYGNPGLMPQDLHNRYEKSLQQSNQKHNLQPNQPQYQHKLSQNYQQPALQHPPYPPPPRYTRRKTWSPPALKLSLRTTRVCHSNDSLDHAENGVQQYQPGQRSYSEDLDMTPPRLAPISGVLAQKPGPNLVKPIAFKPIRADGNHCLSPSGHMTRRANIDDRPAPAHDMPRPQAVRLGTGMLGHRNSPDKVGSALRPLHPASTSSLPDRDAEAAGFHHVESGHGNPQTLTSHVPLQHASGGGGYHNLPAHAQHPMSASSHHNTSSSSHHSASATSHHNISASSYHNSSGHSHHNSSGHSHHNSSTNSHHNTSMTSSRLSGLEDNSFSADIPRPGERTDSLPGTTTTATSRGWHQTEGLLQTPSPSDSGVGELEQILREKDAEINTLREVMDRNERAILQVYEERRNAWAQDTQELREDFERKMKVQSRKSYKTEQVLSLQVYKLQQEQKSITEEKDKVASERDILKQELEKSQEDMKALQSQLDAKCEIEDDSGDSGSRQDELVQKNKEIINLRSQLHSHETDMERKNKEIAEKVRELSLKKEEVDTLTMDVTRLRNPAVLCDAFSQTHAPSEVTNPENVKPSMMGERERTIQGLQDELMQLKDDVLGLKEEHDSEREQWLNEKNKVVRYQKQLQLNYVQMQRKNQTLETEVQQLTLEMENRDMKLVALSGEESVC